MSSLRKAHIVKNAEIAKIKQCLLAQKSVVIFHHQNLPVKHIQELKNHLKELGGEISVYKNTFLKRAIADTKFKKFNDQIMGPIMIAMTAKDSPLLTKKIYQFLEKNQPQSKIIASFYDGNFYEKEAIQELALLPSQEELLQKLINVLQTPLWNLNSLLESKLAQDQKA